MSTPITTTADAPQDPTLNPEIEFGWTLVISKPHAPPLNSPIAAWVLTQLNDKSEKERTNCKGTSLTTPTSAHLQSTPTYIHISLLSRFIHILTITYFLLRHLRPSEMSRYIFHSPSSSFHTVL